MRYSRLIKLCLFVLATSASLLLLKGGVSLAFTPNDVMSDKVFDNTNTMSASVIDSWLNSNFPSSCISTNHGFSAPDPTGYSPSTGFTYGGPVSAGRVIYDAAVAYGLNPQVLLATLQKEESLVDGGAGCSSLRISASVGYGCPDGGTLYNYSNLNPAMYYINGNPVTSISGTCVKSSADVGFAQQLIHASWLLKFGEQRSQGNTSWDVSADNFPVSGDHWDNSDDPQTCYGGPMTQGNFKRCSTDASTTYFDGYTVIDGTSTHMDSGATAALYWYTPHFSGNQNFDTIFQNWFGSTIGDLVTAGGGGVYKLENNTKRPFPDQITFYSYGYHWSDVTTISSTDLSQIADGSPMSYNIHYRDGRLVSADGNGIYDVYNGQKLPFPDEITFYSYGFKLSDVMSISSTELSYIPVGSPMAYNTHYRDGRLVTSNGNGIYDVYNGQKLPFPDEITFYSYNFKWSYVITISSSELSKIPDGVSMPYNVHYRDGHLVTADGNGIYDVYNGQKLPFPNYETFTSYGYKSSDVLSISATELSYIPAGPPMQPKQ